MLQKSLFFICLFEFISHIAFGQECGISYYTPNARIVGGISATPNSWPSLALIKFSYKREIVSKGLTYTYTFGAGCGGTLINPRTILTAAHCVQKKVSLSNNEYSVEVNKFHPTIGSMYKVYLGLQDKSDLTSGTLVTISQVIVHESYNELYTLNDIALFILANDVTLSNKIQIACLPQFSTNFPVENTPVYAAGWGTLGYGGGTPNLLNNIKLTVYSSNICANVGFTHDWNSQICAGELSGGKDTCQGDSGGPLYATAQINGQTRYVVAGVVSYGIGCADPSFPAGIYTRVSNYITWITSKVSVNLVAPTATNIPISFTTVALTCRNQNEFLCNLYSNRYCNSLAYVSGVLFSNYCPISCNNCQLVMNTPMTTSPSTSIKNTCFDISTSCSYWKNYCSSLTKYREHPCRKTCKLC